MKPIRLPRSAWRRIGRRAKAKGLTTVYRLTFDCGETYIGCTCNLHRRLTEHKNSWDENFKVDVMFWGFREEAEYKEARLIFEGRDSGFVRNKHLEHVALARGMASEDDILAAFSNVLPDLGLYSR